MKIERAVIFTPNLGGGAFPNIACALALGLRTQGVGQVFLAHLDGELPPTDVPPGLEIVRLGTRRTMLSPIAFSRFLRRARPQVTISMPATANVAALVGWWLSGRIGRLVVSEHATMSYKAWVEHRSDLRIRSLPALARRLYPLASGIVAVNEEILDDLASRIGVRLDRRRATVIPNPVDLEKVRRLAHASRPHPWMSAGTTPVGVAVGRLARQKNYPLLIDAMSRLRRETNLRLVIIGDGPERSALQEQVDRLGLQSCVELLGLESNPYPTIASADVLILPSEEEAFGLVVVEALVCGVPVVATDCPGPRAILRDGGGIVVPRGDPDALAAAVVEVVRRTRERPALTSAAGDVTTRYAPERIAGEWLEFIDSLPGREEPAPRSRSAVGAPR